MTAGPAFAPALLPFRTVPLAANIPRIAPGLGLKLEDAMRIQLPLALLFAAVFACSMHAAPAQAQRVFVSATGSDGNPCNFASPCRTFQHAHDVAPASGEIDVLDPAGYGAMTITKAISIQGHGYAGITVASGANGITINAGSAITLNGLLIDGAGVGLNGIVFNSSGSLTVTNCVLQNFVGSNSTGNGIIIAPTSGTLKFTITNTIVSNNGNYGIHYLPPSGTPSANGIIDHVVATGNQVGGIRLYSGFATGGTTVTAISNSIASNNEYGVAAGTASIPLTVSIDNVSVSENSTIGVDASGPATVLLGRSVIIENGIGIHNATSPNAFYTYGDNRINLNGADISGTALLTTFKPQ
jgi:hypothetical protein